LSPRESERGPDVVRISRDPHQVENVVDIEATALSRQLLDR
jgi:hypothetical protein